VAAGIGQSEGSVSLLGEITVAAYGIVKGDGVVGVGDIQAEGLICFYAKGNFNSNGAFIETWVELGRFTNVLP